MPRIVWESADHRYRLVIRSGYVQSDTRPYGFGPDPVLEVGNDVDAMDERVWHRPENEKGKIAELLARILTDLDHITVDDWWDPANVSDLSRYLPEWQEEIRRAAR